MKKNLLFRGAATALVTPFSDGKIDYPAFGALIDMQMHSGIAALVVCGTTGEASALTEEEHASLVSFAKERVQGRLPVIAGCGSPSTKHAEMLIRDACSAGADAVLVVTPYYNKCSQEGLYRHFITLADASRVPLLLYEVPARTGVRMEPDTCQRLSQHENIAGIKDATGDAEHASAGLDLCGDALPLYSGCDGLTVPLLSLGAQGVISVLSNFAPAAVSALCSLWFSGDTAAAGLLQCRLSPVIRALFSEVSPIPVKTVMAESGICREEFRLPLCPLSKEKRELLFSRIRKVLPETVLFSDAAADSFFKEY